MWAEMNDLAILAIPVAFVLGILVSRMFPPGNDSEGE